MHRFFHDFAIASLALALLLGALAMPTAAANEGQSACCHRCPRCTTCCQLKAERVDEEKECWRVKCEQICVPRVVFPWQKRPCDPCFNNGAWVKTIKVLESHTYTCPKCEYTWTPVASTDTRCGAAGCTSHANGTADAFGMIDAASAVPPVAPRPVRVASPSRDLIRKVNGLFSVPYGTDADAASAAGGNR